MEAPLQTVLAISTYPDNDFDADSQEEDSPLTPIETLEQHLIVMEESQLPFPTLDEVAVGRSNSTPPPAIETVDGPEAEESEDVARVEELVGGADDLDDFDGGGDEIPFSADYVDDEPSSVLALRISRAMDNPSPPPSPVLNHIELDPTFSGPSPPGSEKSEGSDNVATYSNEISLPDKNTFQLDWPADSTNQFAPNASNMEIEATQAENPPPQSDLISFGPITPLQIPLAQSPMEQGNDTPDSAVSAVDALLLKSPSIEDFRPPYSESRATGMVEELVDIVPPSDTSSASTPPPPLQLRRSPRKSVIPPAITGTPQAPSTPFLPTSRSPRKKKAKIEEIVEDSQDEGETFLPIQSSSLMTTPRNKERRRSRSPLVFSREIGSLSPTTSNLLTQLIPSFTDATPLQLDSESTNFNEQSVTSQEMQSFSVFSAPSEPTPSTPKRPLSPGRPIATPSSSKLRVQLSEHNIATPARRITIEEAIESGHISPVKGAQMGYTPRSGLPLMPPTPARRILISDKSAQAPPSATKTTLRFGSRVHGRPQEPPSQALASSNQVASTPSFQRPTASTSSRGLSPRLTNPTKLPFPLVVIEKPPSATTAIGGKDVSKQQPPISSPMKSNLKQVTSRIPRIGSKPYAKPPSIAKAPIQKLAPVPAPPRSTTMRKVDLSKPGTSRMIVNRGLSSSSSLTQMKGKETLSIRPLTPATSTIGGAPAAAVKRKRSPDKTVSPVKSRMPSSRQPPGAASTSRIKVVPPKKVVQPKRLGRKPVDPVPAPAPPDPPAPSQQAKEVTADFLYPQKLETAQVAPTPMEPDDELGSPMKEDAVTESSAPIPIPNVPQAPPIPTFQIDPPMETPPIETLPPPPSGIRRTTRQRKTTSLVDPVAPEPVVSRRRKSVQGPRFVFTDAYSEMSATALKQLTTTNTVLNQHYLSARLEVEVVKKDGLRPESPMVKIKTVAQRQADVQQAKRSERAMRRARRSGEIPGSSDQEMGSDDEAANSDADELPRWPPMQHTKGAGEDEIYETPDRAFKRMKLTDSGAEGLDADVRRKRVKWDRGLYTTVYLDEVILGTRQPLKELIGLKGCLAPTAKALRLDTLGNLNETEAPLPELPPHNVTVKKFVYEGEVVEPAEEVPPPIPKTTRSKSKKAKS